MTRPRRPALRTACLPVACGTPWSGSRRLSEDPAPLHAGSRLGHGCQRRRVAEQAVHRVDRARLHDGGRRRTRSLGAARHGSASGNRRVHRWSTCCLRRRESSPRSPPHRHVIALKLLARDDATHPQDAADLRALREVVDDAEVQLAREAVALIDQRGFARDRDLNAALTELLTD